MPKKRTAAGTRGAKRRSAKTSFAKKSAATKAPKPRGKQLNPFAELEKVGTRWPTLRACPPAPRSLAERLEEEEYESESELRNVLEALEEDAVAVLKQFVEHAHAKDASHDQDAAMRATAQRLLDAIPRLTRAIDRGQPWTAARHALFTGLLAGNDQMRPYVAHFQQRLHRQEPDAARGRKVRDSGREGGRQGGRPRKATDAATLCRAVSTAHQRNPQRSWTAVCKAIGKEHGLGSVTVSKHAASVRWARSAKNY